jgi:hypothetical protein
MAAMIFEGAGLGQDVRWRASVLHWDRILEEQGGGAHCRTHFGNLVDKMLDRSMRANLQLGRKVARENLPGQNEIGRWDNCSQEADSLVLLGESELADKVGLVDILAGAIDSFEPGEMAAGGKLEDAERHMLAAGSLGVLEAQYSLGLGRREAPQLLERTRTGVADTG